MAAIEENDSEVLAVVIGQVVRTQGTSRVAKATSLTRQALYKMFSPKGNPTLQSIISMLNAFGLQLNVKPKTSERGHRKH